MAPPPRSFLGLGRAVREDRLEFWRLRAAGSGGGEEKGSPVNAGWEAALCNLFGAARSDGGGWQCRPGEREILGIIAEKRRLLLLLVREGVES